MPKRVKRTGSTLISFSDIDKLTFTQARKIYSEYRSIFNKRIGRLQKAGYAKRAEPYAEGGHLAFPLVAERLAGESDAEQLRSLRMGIRELTNLLREDTSSVSYSVSGIREAAKRYDERIIDSLHRSGLEHISKSTVKKFGSFMDMMRQEYGKKLPNSDLLAQFFDQLKYKNKKRSNEWLMKAWREYESNGYDIDESNQDLFRM